MHKKGALLDFASVIPPCLLVETIIEVFVQIFLPLVPRFRIILKVVFIDLWNRKIVSI